MGRLSISQEAVQELFAILQKCLQEFQQENKTLYNDYGKIVRETNNKRYLDLGNEIFDSYNKEINGKLREKMMRAWRDDSSTSLSNTLRTIGAGAKAEELARMIEAKIEDTLKCSAKMALLQINLTGEVVSDDRDYDKIIQLLNGYKDRLNQLRGKYYNIINNKNQENQLYMQLKPVIMIIFDMSTNFFSIIKNIVKKEKDNFVANRLRTPEQPRPSGRASVAAGAVGAVAGAAAGMAANTASRGTAVPGSGGARQNTAGAAPRRETSIEDVLRRYAKVLIEENDNKKDEAWKKLAAYLAKYVFVQKGNGQSNEELAAQLMIIYETYFNFTRMGVEVKSANGWETYTNKSIAVLVRENPDLVQEESGWEERYSPGIYRNLSRLIQRNCREGRLDRNTVRGFLVIKDLIENEIQMSEASEYEYPHFCETAGQMILKILEIQPIKPGYQFLARADIKDKTYKDVVKDIGIRVFEEMYKDWHEVQVSNEEKAAIHKYTSEKDETQTDIYKLVNNTLRGDNPDESGIYSDIINKIKEALGKAAAPDNILLYRSASLLDFKELAQTEDTKKIAYLLEREPGRFIGKTLEIPTFLSTTICENMVGDVTYDKSSKRYELVIQTPKGTLAGFLPLSDELGFTKHGGEREVLLADGMILQIKSITMRSPEEQRLTGGSDLKYKVTAEIVREENKNLMILRGEDFDEERYTREDIENLMKELEEVIERFGGVDQINEVFNEDLCQFMTNMCKITKNMNKEMYYLQSKINSLQKEKDSMQVQMEKGQYGRYSVNKASIGEMAKWIQLVKPVLDRLDKAYKEEFDKKVKHDEKIAFGFNIAKQVLGFLTSAMGAFVVGNFKLDDTINSYSLGIETAFLIRFSNLVTPYIEKCFKGIKGKRIKKDVWELLRLNMEIYPRPKILEQYISEHYSMKQYKRFGLDKNNNPFSKKKVFKYYEQGNVRWPNVHRVLYNVTDEKARRVFEDAFFAEEFWFGDNKNNFAKCKNKEEYLGVQLNMIRAAMVRSDYSQQQTATGMVDSLYDIIKDLKKIEPDTSKYPTELWSGRRIRT